MSGGRTHGGCDCYGLVRLVLHEQAGILLPDLSSAYGDALDADETSPLFQQNLPLLTGRQKDVPALLDVAVIRRFGRPTHIGIYAGGGYILHTIRTAGTVLQRVTHPDLRQRIEGYYAVEAARAHPSVPGGV